MNRRAAERTRAAADGGSTSPPWPAALRDRGRPHRPPRPTASAARSRPRTPARGPQPHGGPLQGTGAAGGKRSRSGRARLGKTPSGAGPRCERTSYEFGGSLPGKRPYDFGGRPRSGRQRCVHHAALADRRQIERQRAPLQPVQHPRHLVRAARGQQQPHPVALHGHRGARCQMAQAGPARIERHVQDVEARAHGKSQRGSRGPGHRRPSQFVLVPPADLIARLERPTGKGTVVTGGTVPTMPSETSGRTPELRWVFPK